MIKQYSVDAFAEKVFHGNPAAVCILDAWLPDSVMRCIAAENNLSETAFAVGANGQYHLRWFTPCEEIDLCGHATLAAAFVLMNIYERSAQSVSFDTLSGLLTVRRDGELFAMDFPAFTLEKVLVTDAMEEAIGIRPTEAWLGRDLVCVLPTEFDVRTSVPDAEKTKFLPGLILHTTACSDDTDYVLRSFAPKIGIAEDPVCGSGNCHTAPLWADKLKKCILTAEQASARGGILHCTVNGERVELAGKAVLYAASELYIDERA